MKKIIFYILLVLSFFVWNNVFADDYGDNVNSSFENIWAWEGNNSANYSWVETDPNFVWPSSDLATWNNQSNSSSSSWGWGCTYSEWTSLSSFLNWCKPKTVVWWSDMSIEWGFKSKINKWIKNISLILWIWAVWALVYAAILLQLSGWEDEQIKKAKNIVKRTIIGFLLLISASWIIYIVINVMFWIWN